MTTLLPPSTSRTERNLATAGEQAMQLPLPFRSLWSPWTCPTHLLPYLAASWSVDRWDDKWPESTKRQVIANSYFVHSHKGTIGAIRRVVEPLGYLIRVLEWWQETPNAAPGTFKLDIGVLDTGITETMYQELERLIADAKPMTRHLTGLAISMETRGQLYLGAA
ncbi:TPA: phage tail protein I, partial [Aeromonas hydrophila]|nr:phage tail protein I [Aeromonas hydrophila]